MLIISGIRKSYGRKAVLENISLSLRPGEAVGIVGHNGSGKSTFLSIIAQLVRPDAGEIHEDDRSVLGDRSYVREHIGYIPQNDWLLSDLTVKETLDFWQSIHRMNEPVFAADSIASQLGLDLLAGKKVSTLSGGMQKRLSIALAFLHHPRYLLIDEALPALDRRYRLTVLERLAGFRDQGGAVLYSSHRLDDVRAFCDRILVLREGKAVLCVSTEDFPTDGGTLDALLNPLESVTDG